MKQIWQGEIPGEAYAREKQKIFMRENRKPAYIGTAIVCGVFLLLCCLNVIEFDMIWKLALPVIIIMIGIKLIFGGIFSGKSAQMLKKAKENGADVKNGFAAFSGQDMNFDGEVFNGAELNAVFGGVKCDLRNAIIQNDCVITTSCIFGGIDILLPDHVNVKVNSNSLFGGVSDKKHSNSKDNTVTVYINSTCIFGGVDIK